MTTTSTINYSFLKPDVGTEIDLWGTIVNTDLDSIDTQIKNRQNEAATAQAAAVAAQATATAALPKAGGTMTGPIVLSADGAAALQPASFGQLTTTNNNVTAKSDKGVADAQTTYAISSTLALTDAGATVLIGAAGALVLTVPPQVSVVWAARTRIDIIRTGAGEVSIAPGAAVTIVSDGSKLRLNAQWAGATLYRQASDSWILVGNLKT